MKKTIISAALTAIFCTLLTLGIYHQWNQIDQSVIKVEHIDSTPAKGAVYTLDEDGDVVPLDFSEAAEKVMNSVVHITSTSTRKVNSGNPQMEQMPDIFRDFFGERDNPFFRFEERGQGGQPRPRIGTGSGVIINEEGYIATNNHVIENADDLEVTLHDNRTFKAKVIGTDPTTDLALIQIEAKELPALALANSDNVKVGEWVLAVGNPLGLNSTVTAGIVSAKGRSINILREQFAVESFIQTDAAINPGNSGGALVNLEGNLIGINTAIASPTGSYAGYGFAVPTNIVSKVIEDLLEYGSVQRGVLGISIRPVTSGLVDEKELSVRNGVYIENMLESSAGEEAGLQPGDVIVAIEDKEINTVPELQEMVARYRPDDKIKVKINRDGTEKSFDVTLKSRNKNAKVAVAEYKDIYENLGVQFSPIDEATAQKLNITGGVKVEKLFPGKIRSNTTMEEGFIITHINGKKVKTIEEAVDLLNGYSGGVMLEGVYEDSVEKVYYGFGM